MTSILATVCAVCASCAPVDASEPLERWSYVYATIIAPNCTTSACHARLSHAGMLDMHDHESAYAALTGASCLEPGPVAGFVDVASPPDSALVGLLTRPGATGMPPNAPLADAEIAVIETWMSRGAPCD